MNIYFMGMILSMIVYIVLGLVISRQVKDVNDFFVAGRQAPTFLIVGSLVASYCSTVCLWEMSVRHMQVFIPRL